MTATITPTQRIIADTDDIINSSPDAARLNASIALGREMLVIPGEKFGQAATRAKSVGAALEKLRNIEENDDAYRASLMEVLSSPARDEETHQLKHIDTLKALIKAATGVTPKTLLQEVDRMLPFTGSDIIIYPSPESHGVLDLDIGCSRRREYAEQVLNMAEALGLEATMGGNEEAKKWMVHITNYQQFADRFLRPIADARDDNGESIEALEAHLRDTHRQRIEKIIADVHVQLEVTKGLVNDAAEELGPTKKPEKGFAERERSREATRMTAWEGGAIGGGDLV